MSFLFKKRIVYDTVSKRHSPKPESKPKNSREKKETRKTENNYSNEDYY